MLIISIGCPVVHVQFDLRTLWKVSLFYLGRIRHCI